MRRLLLGTSLALLAQAGSAMAQEEISVSVVNGHPPVFLWVKHLTETFIPTVDAALEGTDYKINWTENYGGTLAAVGGELEALEDGLAEVGIVPTVFEPTALPLQNISYFTPFSAGDPKLVMQAMEQLYADQDAMREEWARYGIEHLGGGFTLDNYVLMTSFPVDSIDDLEGKRIAAPGPAVNWLEGTGAVGVSGNLTTYYSDIQTGVFEGVITFPTAAAAANLQEVAPYTTVTNFGAQYAGALVANADWYADQPEEVQNALREGAIAYTQAYLDEQEQLVAAAMETLDTDAGGVSEMSDEEKKRWADALPQIASTWQESAAGDGADTGAVLDAYIGALQAGGAPLLRDWRIQ
ncbi:C4-dicarboxylate TRAP transporter substrate-binding protein [Paracoccus aerodenitrificans]|uniref:C4-dicarboxylate TRAP transporter substrate-binding protein n=1 Tax=Paracoccus aerodenitrificans TaxID=3017781 RepID=UPI0022F0B929|nr:C4-dicarboxylate TRAP transporter substrate-binding protein [Paracoccus aerodenitrificans]WBU63551.1 C4-dicarboxylate TRAP transporter substrate-binding protein [Paracoccus aerodenitrificans]